MHNGLVRTAYWQSVQSAFRWNYVLLAYGVVAFLASFKAAGLYMNILAIAQVLVRYDDDGDQEPI